MKIAPLAIATLALVASAAPPALARQPKPQWVHDGQAYESYEACIAAKKKSRNRAAIVGAAAAGTVAAISGANLGKTALVAGAGAATGAVIGSHAKKC